MSVWAIAVGAFCDHICYCLCRNMMGTNAPQGNYHHLLPTKAIIAGPFLAVLGGECVFQSTIFTLTSALTSVYVQR
jgi:hypothetical protein